jgi:hypothetical protein
MRGLRTVFGFFSFLFFLTQAVMEFMKATGLGYTGKLHADAERRGGGVGDDDGEGGSDGGGGERGEEGGGSDRGGVGEAHGEGAEDGSDGEWRFALFEWSGADWRRRGRGEGRRRKRGCL